MGNRPNQVPIDQTPPPTTLSYDYTNPTTIHHPTNNNQNVIHSDHTANNPIPPNKKPQIPLTNSVMVYQQKKQPTPQNQYSPQIAANYPNYQYYPYAQQQDMQHYKGLAAQQQLIGGYENKLKPNNYYQVNNPYYGYQLNGQGQYQVVSLQNVNMGQFQYQGLSNSAQMDNILK